MATPDERAGRIRGNLNTRADRLSGNNNARAERIRGNLTSREQRQTKSLVEGLQALAVPERQPPRLSRSEPRGAIPAARGYSEVNQQPGSAVQGGGIASPLIEGGTPADPPADDPDKDMTAEPKPDREYYADSFNLYSSDYILAVEIKPLKTLTMRDSNANEVVFNFAKPPEPEAE